MIMRNTSKYDTKEVRLLVDFASRGFNTSKVCINVKSSKKAYYGRAYRGVPYISNAPTSADYLVVVRIGNPDKFPVKEYYSNVKYKRLIPVTFETWQEALVCVTAHELAHIQQYKQHKPCSEVKASQKGYKKLMEYRQGVIK